MKTKNISESLGYIIAINDVLAIIREMSKEHDLINASDLTDKIVVGKKDLSIQEGEYYTVDMIDPKNPYKSIAGEDALFLNPVYERNSDKK